MFPTLFNSNWIGLDGAMHFTLSSYFSAILLGFSCAAWLAYREASLMGIDKGKFKDFIVWMLIMGILGSRILHVLVDGFFMDYVHLATNPFLMDGRPINSNMPCDFNSQCLTLQERGYDVGGICNPEDGLCYPQKDPFRWLKFWAGGLVVYGSIIGCATFAYFYIKKYQLGLAKIFDLGGYGIFFGIFVGRLGCLAAGCCFGAVCDIEQIAIQFPNGSLAHQHHFDFNTEALAAQAQTGDKQSLPIWPTQLISSTYAFIIFLLAYFVIRPRKRFHGQVFLTSIALYAGCRFCIEFVRDDFRGSLLGLSTSQVISLIAIILCVGFIFRGLKKAKQQAVEPADEKPDDKDKAS